MKYEEAMIISNPLPAHNRSAALSLQKFIAIFPNYFTKIHIITSNYEKRIFAGCSPLVSLHSVSFERKCFPPYKLFNFFLMQLQLCRTVAAIAKRKKTTVFFWIGDKMILPFIYCKFAQMPIFYFLMGNIANETATKSAKSYLSGWLIQFMARHSRYVCTESKSVLEQWPNLIAFPNLNIIHLFVDIQQFTKIKAIGKRKKIIGMLTRLAPGKHVLQTILAFSEFWRQNRQWKLQIIGDGPDRGQCRRLITALNCDIELADWVDHRELPAYLNEWRLTIMPTSAEGLPNSLLECMACGTPALATPVGGIKDLIEPNRNGWFLRGTAKEEILHGFQTLPEEAALESMSEEAVRTIHEKYSYHASRQNFERVMEQVQKGS